MPGSTVAIDWSKKAVSLLDVAKYKNATALNKTQFEAKLREMNKLAWTKSDALSEVEQESVIGTYRFSRLVSPAENEDDTALYELWIREVWAHQVAGKWKIYRETWQVYENIPKL